MKKFLKNNGLSLTFFFLFLLTIVGQAITGIKQHNQHRVENGATPIEMRDYLTSGHFLQATFENWESEFLQMALFLFLSVFLYQKGSSESKDPDQDEEVDREPSARRKNAPKPVRIGGFVLKLYRHSLVLAFTLLFLGSFVIHWQGSVRDYNEEQKLKGKSTETPVEYLGNSRLWFESFQNWESEFVSILSIVLLSIFLREHGSPQSKPVDAPHSKTGSS